VWKSEAIPVKNKFVPEAKFRGNIQETAQTKKWKKGDVGSTSNLRQYMKRMEKQCQNNVGSKGEKQMKKKLLRRP